MSTPITQTANQNPFATEFTDSVPYRFQSGDWQENWNRLSELNFHAAIIGPKGTGKTTLLEALAEKLRDQFGDSQVLHRSVGWDLESSRTFVATLLSAYRQGAILLVDSIERLSFLQRRKLLKLRPSDRSSDKNDRPSGIIVTSHSTCRLPTWIETSGSIESLTHVLDHLPDFVNRESVLESAAVALQNHNGNVRDTVRQLYDQFAEGNFTSTN